MSTAQGQQPAARRESLSLAENWKRYCILGGIFQNLYTLYSLFFFSPSL